QEEPGIQYRVWVQRNAVDPMIHKPLGEVSMVRGALPTNTDVFARCLTTLDGIGQKRLDRIVTFIEQMGHNARVTVQSQGQLGQVVGTDGEAIEVLQEL